MKVEVFLTEKRIEPNKRDFYVVPVTPSLERVGQWLHLGFNSNIVSQLQNAGIHVNIFQPELRSNPVYTLRGNQRVNDVYEGAELYVTCNDGEGILAGKIVASKSLDI